MVGYVFYGWPDHSVAILFGWAKLTQLVFWIAYCTYWRLLWVLGARMVLMPEGISAMSPPVR